MARKAEPPVVLVKWYDFAKWLLERVDSFPKNQRFIFGQRLADHALDIFWLLVESACSTQMAALLGKVTRARGALSQLLGVAFEPQLIVRRRHQVMRFSGIRFNHRY